MSYTNLSLKQLEDQYKEALETNQTESVLSEFVAEFQSRNIAEPYIGQTGANPPPESTKTQLLQWELDKLRLDLNAARSDGGLILPEGE